MFFGSILYIGTVVFQAFYTQFWGCVSYMGACYTQDFTVFIKVNRTSKSNVHQCLLPAFQFITKYCKIVKTLKEFLDQPCLILASCTASFMTSMFFCGASPVSRYFRRSSTCCFRWSPNTCVGISSQNKVYESYTVCNYL